jgi:hypothetical protein
MILGEPGPVGLPLLRYPSLVDAAGINSMEKTIIPGECRMIY